MAMAKARSSFLSLGATACALSFCAPAIAGTICYWRDDAPTYDWSDGANYVGGTAPSAGDTVVVGNATVQLSNADMASFSLASSLERIQPTNENAKIVFAIDGDDAECSFFASIRYHDTSDMVRMGTIVKRGSGSLDLKNTAANNSYLTDIVVEEGSLSIAESSMPGVNGFYGDVAVSNGATFVSRTSGRAWVGRLSGEGTVSKVEAGDQICVRGGSFDTPVELTPWMSGLVYYSSGRVMIRRTDNTMGQFFVFCDSANAKDGRGVTGFYKIGKKNEASSVGTSDALRTAERGGTFLYLGDGNETETDKKVVAHCAGQGPTELDAGAYGGLTFNGAWEFGGSAGYGQGMGMLVLSGSNTHECVIAGSVKNGTLANEAGDKGFSFHITKKGAGIWRLTDVGNKYHDSLSSGTVRENNSGVAVEEGTLRFDSLLGAGDKCALGMATNLYEAYCGAPSSAPSVPYAIRLGAPERRYPDSAIATFEYTGTAADAICSSRPVVVDGDARILNSSAKRFRLGGISALSAGVNLLVLGGDGGDNEVANLTDGAAGCRLGVVKEGGSTWCLTATNSFSGPVVVKGGTLKVRHVDSGKPYSWYKLVIKDLWTRGSRTDYFKLGRIGLFDANGYRQNIGFSKNTTVPVGLSLNPGEIGRGVPVRYYAWYDQSYEKMCATGQVEDKSCLAMQREKKTIDPDDPLSWIEFSMRLTNNTPEIAYYDLAVVYGNNGSYPQFNVRSWALLGSTDGWNWDELHAVADSKTNDGMMKIPNGNNTWMAQNKTTGGESAATKHDTAKLQPIRGHSLGDVLSPLENVEYIAVSDGGVLEADGDIELKSFRVAAGARAGTVRGFKLSKDCRVDVTGLPERVTSFDLPVEFENMAVSDSSWTLTVDGAPTEKYRIKASQGKLRLVVKALIITVR